MGRRPSWKDRRDRYFAVDFLYRRPSADVLEPLFIAVDAGEIRLVASTVSLLEVLVHPLRHGDDVLASRYSDVLLSTPYISTIPVTPTTVQVAAELRATSNLKTPDAIHLATAINHDADVFLTNDRDFGQIDSLEVIKVRDLASST
ncbi:MAG: PIN domain-containing protein [Pirellulales bacterium]|nr:PIN domain-containing protein [Pirellulales bacterium]